MDYDRKDQDSDTPLLLQLIIHKHGTVHTQFVAEAAWVIQTVLQLNEI